MAQTAYDALSEKRQFESAGFSATQADAIVESMTRAVTVSQQMAQELVGVDGRLGDVESRLATVENELVEVKAGLAEVRTSNADIRTDLAEVKSEMATGKDIEAAVATLRADMYRALWAQGLGLGTLILGLAVLVAAVAVF